MIDINDTFTNSTDHDPVHVSLRDKEYGMLVLGVKPPVIPDKLNEVVSLGASLFVVKPTPIVTIYDQTVYTLHGMVAKDFDLKKPAWVRFSEHCKSQLLGLLLKAVSDGKMLESEWVYFLVGKSVHFVILTKAVENDKTN